MIEFINNTPDTTGPNITGEYQIDGCINETICKIGEKGEIFACEHIYLFCLHVKGVFLYQVKIQCFSHSTVFVHALCLSQLMASVETIKQLAVFFDLVS